MALSLSFPSSKAEHSGHRIFECGDGDQDKSNPIDHAVVSNEESEKSQEKMWKSTPTLNLTTNKGSLAEEDYQQLESSSSKQSQQQRNVRPPGSFIPVPLSRRTPDKSELTLENLINSNSSGSSVKGLPDVTESPQTPFSSDKPCDLLAQLEIVAKQREMETSGTGSSPGESDSVDDNGNPVEAADISDTDDSLKEEEVQEEHNKGDIMEEIGTDKSNTPENEQSELTLTTSTDGTKPISQSSEQLLPFDVKSPGEPKYFINAAALSEDGFELPPSPAPSPCSSQFNSLNFLDPYPSLCPFVPDCPPDQSDGAVASSSKTLSGTRNPEKSSGIPSRPTEKSVQKTAIPQKGAGPSSVRSRVPVSKSFPDIVQTTFSNNEEKEMRQLSEKTTKDNSDTESLVADSLEELRQVEPTTSSADSTRVNVKQNVEEPEAAKPLKAFEQPLTSYSFDPMTESQIGGISAEKPPEAWVIDFSSLSLESDLMESSTRERRSSMGSNPSSLAFFVNLDDKSEESTLGTVKDTHESLSTPDKKIFTMFVDIGEKDIGGSGNSSQIPPCQTKSSDSESLMSVSMTMGSKRGIINKPVMNIMETSGCGGGTLKYPMNRRFPSPIFQHKAAAEASRKAARMEFLKEREKYGGIGGGGKEQFLDSLEPQSAAFTMRNEGDTMMKSQLVDSTSSNRSSLHVANVLDASFTSSLLSSMENSSPADMDICQGGPCFKLGKDLLRMFQEGINTDVNITVHGKCIKAHKCILASRSQYFAAMLSGCWVENAGNTINLDGFSYTVVQFTMYHIYSGTNEIPDTIDLLELATLTDLLGLEGLRENISQTIRTKFCHNFHRPCTGCITGVIECFPIALAYGMDELNRKMTKWICKHFVRIWPTKAFANLGDELIEKCLRYSVNHLSVDNILDHTLGCDQLLTTMPTVRWTEPIFSIVGQLSEACVQYIGQNFCEVLQSDKFLLFGKGQTWNISRIEGTFMEALNLLKPDEACVSHTALSRLIELGVETIDEVEWSTLFVDFLKMLRGEIERYLLANASKAVLSKGWEQLGKDVQKRICTSSFMGFDKFGNKIVKGHTTSSGSGGAGHAQPTTVPVQNVKPTTKDRSGNYNSGRSKKQMSVPITTTVTKEPNKEPILSPMTANPAKVASVRPMQAEKPQATAAAKPPPPTASARSNAAPPPPVPHHHQPTSSTAKHRSSSSHSTATVEARENKVLSRVTSQKSFTPPSAVQRSSASVPRNKFGASGEREKSFAGLPRGAPSVAATSSANRTPLKPLTPSKTDSPIVQHNTYGRSTGSSRRVPRPKPVEPKPPPPPAKVFLTNSAKAAAVSKPNLKGSVTGVAKRTPSSSSTSLLSQQSAASSTKTTANTHGPAAPSRYLSSREVSRASENAGGLSARSSFSSSERSGAVKAKVMSNPPRRNTYSNAAGGGNAGALNKNTGHGHAPSTSGSTKRPLSGGGLGAVTSQHNHAHPSHPPNRNMTEMQSNYSKDNVMSRSTIETDSGETKYRSLAEIGRSSTFSKDEPTILGKMDGSTYSQLDMEISP